MRKDILEYLLAHKGKYVSGQMLSDTLGVSRTAVWKNVSILREQGYVIESTTKKGYCLKSAPELLQPEMISKKLSTTCLGHPIIYLEKTKSTNLVAKKKANEGAPEGTLVLSEEQSSGRGRLNRFFLSPYAKGLWFSLVLRPTFLPMEVSKITLLAAVAVTKVLRKYKVECGIKWPNDILVNGRKLVGILTELNASMEKINYLIMGIGINTGITQKNLPDELKDTVTSLAMEHFRFKRNKLLRDVLVQLERYYFLAEKVGFDPILDEWKTLSCTLGEEVEVIMPDRTFSGTAINIDHDGNLIVQTSYGLERVLAGDVRVRNV